MALREINTKPAAKDGASGGEGTGYVNPGRFAVGDKIEGNFMGLKSRVVKYTEKATGADKKFTTKDVIIKGTDGKTFSVNATGTFKYLEKDTIETKQLKAGDYVVFTCWKSDPKNPRFNIAVDDERAITVPTGSEF